MRFFILKVSLLIGSVFVVLTTWAQSESCPQLQGYFGHQPVSEIVRMNTQSYRTAKDYTGKDIKLQADIYQANVNWLVNIKKTRPLIVLYHGGGFKTRARNSGIMKLLATYFAQRGYVAVSAEYRIGWENDDQTALCGGGTTKDYLDAQYRAMQDERALVQYFKNQSQTIGFDTNRIFLMGISSGATLVCSRLETDWIAQSDQRSERLGELENVSRYSTDVAGILSFAGANLSPDIALDYNTPIAFFHGTCDNAVPYYEHHLASCLNMGYYYGPGYLHPNLVEKGICSHNYIYCGMGHDLSAKDDHEVVIPRALEDVLNRSISFMQSVMCENCSSIEEVANESIEAHAPCQSLEFVEICGNQNSSSKNKVFLTPNIFQDDYQVYVHSDLEQSQEYVLNVYDMSGRLVQSQPIYCPSGVQVQTIQLQSFIKGVYLYQIVQSKKLVSAGKLWKP